MLCCDRALLVCQLPYWFRIDPNSSCQRIVDHGWWKHWDQVWLVVDFGSACAKNTKKFPQRLLWSLQMSKSWHVNQFIVNLMKNQLKLQFYTIVLSKHGRGSQWRKQSFNWCECVWNSTDILLFCSFWCLKALKLGNEQNFLMYESNKL